jgi:hypothetical protein
MGISPIFGTKKAALATVYSICWPVAFTAPD